MHIFRYNDSEHSNSNLEEKCHLEYDLVKAIKKLPKNPAKYLINTSGYRKIGFSAHFYFYFLAFDFCRFFVVISFFSSPPQRPMTSDFYTRSYPLHYFLILILEKEPVLFPFSMLSAKQGHYWYHFYNIFGMTWSLTGD